MSLVYLILFACSSSVSMKKIKKQVALFSVLIMYLVAALCVCMCVFYLVVVFVCSIFSSCFGLCIPYMLDFISVCRTVGHGSIW